MERRPAHPLRIWRASYSITMKALAAEMGVSQSYLSEVERGIKRPAFKNMMSIRAATRYDVTADEMMDWWADNIEPNLGTTK